LIDIRNFYLEKGLEPRIYNPFSDGYFEENKSTFEECGFTIQKYGFIKYMLLTEQNQINVKGNLTIKRIIDWDNRIAEDIYALDDDTFTPIVIMNSLMDKDFYCFVGYMSNKAVTIASVYYSKYGCARLDNVETAQTHRRRGYSRKLISYIVDYHRRNRNIPFLYGLLMKLLKGYT